MVSLKNIGSISMSYKPSCTNALFLDLIGRDWEVVDDKIVEMLYVVLKTENIQATSNLFHLN